MNSAPDSCETNQFPLELTNLARHLVLRRKGIMHQDQRGERNHRKTDPVPKLRSSTNALRISLTLFRHAGAYLTHS